MPMKIRLIVETVICLIVFGVALWWVSSIPEGTPGLIYKIEKPKYEIYVAETPVIADIPYKLFEDPPITIEVDYATPSSAIEEPKKKPKEPSMTYYADMELTAYEYTGNCTADGSVPVAWYTVASNDPNLWHKHIWISGYGEFWVCDTGGMSLSCLDIYLGDYDSCIQFGRRIGKVYICE